MRGNRKDSELLDALAHLETCLETPLVPGELAPWTDEVERATDEVQGRLRQAIDKEHAQLMEEIAEQDAGLFRRLEQIKKADQESLAKLDDFHHRLDSLREHAESIEPDETRFADFIKKVTDAGLDLVIHARKQEVALDTWTMEAFDRDRGTAD